MNKTFTVLIIACGLVFSPQVVLADVDGKALFNEKCTACHALDKQKMGPAVKDMNKDLAALKTAISDGIDNAGLFPMPAFGEILKPAQIDDLILYISKQP